MDCNNTEKFYFIEINLEEEFGQMKPKRDVSDPIFINHLSPKDPVGKHNTFKHYEDFYKVIKHTLEFATVIEYKTTLHKKTEAYTIQLMSDNDEEKLFNLYIMATTKN